MPKIDQAVLLAAGRGTRMRELTNDLPKPMIEVRGKPVLQHIVEGLRDAGVPQAFDDMLQHRFAANFDHRFGQIVRELAHPRAAAGGKKNGLVDLRHEWLW